MIEIVNGRSMRPKLLISGAAINQLLVLDIRNERLEGSIQPIHQA